MSERNGPGIMMGSKEDLGFDAFLRLGKRRRTTDGNRKSMQDISTSHEQNKYC